MAIYNGNTGAYKLMDELPIYLIGDSHVGCIRQAPEFLTCIPPFEYIDVSSTAYMINTNIKQIGKDIFKKHGIYLFWFGEIDVRLHFRKLRISPEQFISNSVEAYKEMLLSLDLPKMFGIISIPPPSVEPNEIKVRLYHDFNKELEKMCDEIGINFIDIYSLTVDKDGMLQEQYRRDGVHYSNAVVPLLKKTIMETIN